MYHAELQDYRTIAIITTSVMQSAVL